MAARFWVPGGTGNTNSTTNWSASSGGASGASVPTSADSATWDANSGVGTVTVNATLSVLSATFTNFAGTLAGSSVINIYAGGITLGAGMTITYTGSLVPQASSSWTSNGKQWNGAVSITSTTITFIDNWDVLGNFIQGASSIFLGSTVTVRANLNINNLISSSTTNFILAGSGSWSITGDAGQSDYTIAATGNYIVTTILGMSGSNKILTLLPGGTLTANTGGISMSGSGILDLLNTSFSTLTFTGSSSFTFNTSLTALTTLIVGSAGQVLNLNGSTVYVAGSMIVAGTSSQVSGTTVIETTGTGSLTSTQTTGFFELNINFNNGANTFTISGNIRYRIGTLTRLSGTVLASTSHLFLVQSCTLNTVGITWNNVTISGAPTITNNSAFVINGTLAYALGSTVTFAGTTGWTASTFDIQTSSTVNHILKSALTYIVTTNFISIATTNALKDTLKSSVPGVQAIFTLNYGATQSVGFTNATDIDSSLGQPIYVANGTLSNATNWNPLVATDMGGGGSLIFVN